MKIVIGILAGLAWGAVIAFIKHLLVWKPLIDSVRDKTCGEITTSKIMTRYGISIILDIFALFLPFFAKDYLPFSFESALIGTALSLVLLNRLSSISKVIKAADTEENSSEQASVKENGEKPQGAAAADGALKNPEEQKEEQKKK